MKDLHDAIVMALTEEEKIFVRNNKPIMKPITLNDDSGRKIPALVTVYNRPGQGVYRQQSFGVIVIPMLPSALKEFATSLLSFADKIDQVNNPEKESTDAAQVEDVVQ